MSALIAAQACGPAGKPGEQEATRPTPATPTPAPPTPAPAPAPAPAPPTPSLGPEGAPLTVAEHMKDHFTQALRARDALVRGDLAAMKQPADWLADHRFAVTLPETWRPHVGDMQNAARLAQQASDLAVAADAVGAMGAACGSCHKALGAKVEFAGQSPEGKETSVADRMMRHRWAEARMWEGLVGPSDVAWNAGVAALQGAPLHPDMLAENRSPPQEIADLAGRVQTLASRGKLTTGAETRARLYGEYLATCEGCHSKLGIRLKPST